MNKKLIWLILLLVLVVVSLKVIAQPPGFQTEGAGTIETEEEEEINEEFEEEEMNEEFLEEETVKEEVIVEEAGLTPESPFYFVDEIIDDITINLAEGEEKAKKAAEISAEKVAEAKLMADKNLTGETLRALENANVSSMVEDEVSPELENLTKEKMEMIRKMLDDMGETIPDDWVMIGALIDQQKTQAEKNKIAVDLAKKIGDLCEKLALEDYSLMDAEPRCDPDQAPEWLAGFIETELQEREKKATEMVLEMLETCIEDPRNCNCDDIPVKKHREECIENTAIAVKCEYEQDFKACEELEKMGPPSVEEMPEFMQEILEVKISELIEKKEKEMFAKFAPPECIKAGLSTRQECEDLMMEIHGPPPDECMEDGVFIGPERCEEIMTEKYGSPPPECTLPDGGYMSKEECEATLIEKGIIPSECVVNGEFIGRDECEAKMKEKMGEGEGMAPPECEGLDMSECERIMKEKYGAMMPVMPEIPSEEAYPAECEDISPEECGKIMEEKYKAMITPQPQAPEMPSEIPTGEMPQTVGGVEDLENKIKGLEALGQLKGGEKVMILTEKGYEYIGREHIEGIKEKLGEIKGPEMERINGISKEIEKLERYKEEGISWAEKEEIKEESKEEYVDDDSEEEPEEGAETQETQEELPEIAEG